MQGVVCAATGQELSGVAIDLGLLALQAQQIGWEDGVGLGYGMEPAATHAGAPAKGPGLPVGGCGGLRQQALQTLDQAICASDQVLDVLHGLRSVVADRAMQPKVLERHWLPHPVALGVVHSNGTQGFHQLRGLGPFGDGLETQHVAHPVD